MNTTSMKYTAILLALFCLSEAHGEQEIKLHAPNIVCHNENTECKEFEWDQSWINATVFLAELVESIKNYPNLLNNLTNLETEEHFNLETSSLSAKRTKRFLHSFWLKAIKYLRMVKGLIEGSREEQCYERVGCFNYAMEMRLLGSGPSRPSRVRTKFYLYNGEKERHYNPLDGKFTDKFIVKAPLIVTFTGWNEGVHTKWVRTLMKAACPKITCSFINVDWLTGNFGLNYLRAAWNTPMPGAEASLLLQTLLDMNKEFINASDVHLIGFSLGAHVAGFCGRHFYNATGRKLGRITGLDPAGPLFNGTPIALKKGDAQFVDIIHTNGGSLITLHLGMRAATGDVDFYPNGGSEQPGCILPPFCSHTRAPDLFIESINNSSCRFTSYECRNYPEGFQACTKYPESKQSEMGYYSPRKKGRGLQFLNTNGKSPFCIKKDTGR